MAAGVMAAGVMGDCVKGCAAGRDGGFTLVETLVVLAIIAGLLVVAYGAFIPGYISVQTAYQRDDFERQLLELPQRVRLAGHGGLLTSRSGDHLPDEAVIEVEGVMPEAARSIEDWRVLRLSLPPGWRLRVAKPVLYHFSGSCEGGEVVFERPPIALYYDLAAPLCRPARHEAARHDAADRS